MLDPENLLTSFGLIGIYIIVFMETGLLIGFIFPGDTLLLTAGIMAHGDHPFANIWLLAIGIPIAAALGDQLGYTIGKRVGPAIVHSQTMKWIGTDALEKTNAYFDRFGPATVFLARFIAVVRTVTPVIAGFSNMNRKVFTFYSIIGSIAWGSGITLIGYWLGEIPLVRDYMHWVMVAAVLFVFLIIGAQVLRIYLKAKK